MLDYWPDTDTTGELPLYRPDAYAQALDLGQRARAPLGEATRR